MSVKDDVKQLAEKSLEVSKEAAKRAGEKLSQLGDESVVRVEKFQLEKQLKKITGDFGELVAVRLLDEGKETVSKNENDISVFLKEISRLKVEIENRKKSLKKYEKYD